ncbi:MAG: L-2-amino-thiazoline-4-carboxylic acid hydrolase [Lachnospiraceae bacterium]|nr:L-2-amino-thiazoline-4-carboxylic acid hydrolase [Lachnospiraceae bacterium]
MKNGMDSTHLDNIALRLEKKYGRDMTSEIMRNAWVRYKEIVLENADEPKAMYAHTRKRIYPAIAAYDAMVMHGFPREETADFLNGYYEERAAELGEKIRFIFRVPGLYRFIPRFFAKMAGTIFGESAGFRQVWHKNSGTEMRFDMVVCPYQDICVRYGCPEIVKGFCHADDAAYGNMHPRVKWGRTKTLGKGGDMCDFQVTII